MSRVRRPSRRTASVVVVLGVLAGLGAWAPASPAQGQAEGLRSGSVTVVAPDGTPLVDGGSRTPFALRLPEGAACPGDSANDGYRVQSFIVPEGVDPGGLTYESTKPAGEGRWALYAVNSDPFVQGLTALAAAPGQPGPIVDLPLFDFAVFPPGTLAEGVNHVGIACTLANETIRYWDTDLVLTDTPEDEPAQLTWVAVDPPEVAAEGNRLPWIAVGVLAAGLGLLALVRRRRREPAA